MFTDNTALRDNSKLGCLFLIAVDQYKNKNPSPTIYFVEKGL